MELLITAITWFQNHLGVIGGYVGLGAGISVIVQWLKVHFHLDTRYVKFLKLDGPKLINILLTVLTALPFVVDQILQQFGDSTTISPNYAWLFATAVWLHRFAVSPLYAKAKEGLEAKQQQEADAAAYRQLIATQKQRATPVATTDEATTAVMTYDPVTDTVQG